MDNEEETEQEGEELEHIEIFDVLDERTAFEEVNEIIKTRGSVRGTLTLGLHNAVYNAGVLTLLFAFL